MENETENFWRKMNEVMAAQTREITEAVTKNVSENISDTLMALLEDNKKLRTEVETLHNKIKSMEEEKRKNNIIIFGVKELQHDESPIETVIKVIEKDMNISITPNEIYNAYRLGEKKDNKPRPILVTFTTKWRRVEVLRNKKKLNSDIYIKEDFSRETLEKRKQLLPQLKEERSKGNICYFVKDKIIIKEPKGDRLGKRKNDCISPTNKSPNQPSTLAPNKINKTSILDYVARNRSTSLSTPSTSKNVQ